MAPSSVELSHKLSCCICDENLETIGTLHYHQMFSHTTEELSLAVLSLKGLGLVLEESTEVESLLLRNSLAKYPHFILGQGKARNSDSESTMTAESSSTPPSSREHTNNEKVNINNRVIPIKSTSHNIKTSKFSVALRIQKLKEKLDKKKGERTKGPIPKSANIKTLSKNHTNMCEKTPEHQGNSLTTQSRSQVLSDKTSNDSNIHKNLKFKSKKVMKDLKIQPLVNGGSDQVKADEGNAIKSCTNLSPDKIKLKIKNGKKSMKRTLNNNNSFETKNRKLVRNNLGIRPLVQNSLQMECYNESESSDLESGPSCSNEGNGSQSEISNLFTPNSTTSLLSPDNSPHPERHIQSIITRLPNVILPQDDSKLGRHSKRKKQQTPRRLVNNDYLLPSPVAWHHQATVRYNYGVKREPQSDEERNEQEVMQDYFIPRIEMKGVGETLDIGCGTTALDLTEKEVQTVKSITPSSEKAVQSDIPMTNGNGNLQTQNKSKSPKFGKYTECNSSTKKLVSFRKAKVRRRRSAQKIIKSDYKSDTSPVTKREVFTPIPCENLDNIDISSSVFYAARNILEAVDEVKKEIDTKDLMKIYPLGMTDRRFFCEPCGKGYTKKSHLERHLRVHTGERPFCCPYCEKRFAVRSILKQHVRIHTGEKPYSCLVCSQRFPQKSGLMTHMMLHTGKPFKCEVPQCGKAFVSNHKLLQHLRCHDGHRAHTCQVCQSNFFTEGALNDHYKVHARKHSLHRCMICKASFMMEAELKRHLDEHMANLIIENKTEKFEGKVEKFEGNDTKDCC